MVIMASGIARGRVRTTTTVESRKIVGGHITANLIYNKIVFRDWFSARLFFT